MHERRRAPRHRCRLRCKLRHGRRSDDGLVLDVSLSGLLVQTALALGQGDDVALEIEGGLRMKALAWHSRRARRGGDECFVVGMMLSEVGPEYEAFVGRIAGAQPAPRPRPNPAPEPAQAAAAPEPSPPRRPPPQPQQARRSSWWRLRIKQVGGQRTRIVTLAAESKEQAIARSLDELGDGWEIVEAVAAAPR